MSMPRQLPVLLAILLLVPTLALAQGVTLTIEEPELGQWEFTASGLEETTALAEELLDFSWNAISATGTILGYRYGWDLVDPNDPDDPGWVNGSLENVLAAPTISFLAGSHALTVRAEDDQAQVTTGQILVQIQAAVPASDGSMGSLKTRWSGD